MTGDQTGCKTGTLAVVLAFAAAVVFTLAGCGAPDAGPSEPAVFTEADNERTVRASVGDTIEVRLEENPSTGYAWTVTGTDGLKLRDDVFSAPSASPELVGAPGTRAVTFTVEAAGSQRVIGVYARPWEYGPGPSHPDFELTIDVE